MLAFWARSSSLFILQRHNSFSADDLTRRIRGFGKKKTAIQQCGRTISRTSQYFLSKPSTVSLLVGTTGLENIGNTCYMNVIIHVLAPTQELVICMANETFNAHPNRKSACQGQITTEIAQLFGVNWSRKYRYVSPHRFCDAVSARCKDFSGMGMLDAHEFMILLLEWIHDDLSIGLTAEGPPPRSPAADLSNFEAGEAAWWQFRQHDDSIVSRLFHGLQKSTLLSTVCRYESADFETFSVLSLPIVVPVEGMCSLYHCLDQYVRGDLITDWTCPKCRQRRDAHQKLWIWRLPPVIIFHLKRFSFIGGAARKSHLQVSFPLHDLDLSQLVTGPQTDTHSLVYDLYGVVEHHSSQQSGHYYGVLLRSARHHLVFQRRPHIDG